MMQHPYTNRRGTGITPVDVGGGVEKLLMYRTAKGNHVPGSTQSSPLNGASMPDIEVGAPTASKQCVH